MRQGVHSTLSRLDLAESKETQKKTCKCAQYIVRRSNQSQTIRGNLVLAVFYGQTYEEFSFNIKYGHCILLGLRLVCFSVSGVQFYSAKKV